jgi:hypothetical protein
MKAAAVSPSGFEQALGSLARGGTLVCVGLPAQNEMQLPIFQTVLGGPTVKGSIVAAHHDLEEVFELHRRGRTRVERELDDVNDAIGQVLDGSAPAPRMVFRLAEAPTTSAPEASVTAHRLTSTPTPTLIPTFHDTIQEDSHGNCSRYPHHLRGPRATRKRRGAEVPL